MANLLMRIMLWNADIGYEKLTKRWFKPIEDEENGLTDWDESSLASTHNHDPIHIIGK